MKIVLKKDKSIAISKWLAIPSKLKTKLEST